MNSTTKTKISDEKVKEIVNYYFPQAQIERVEEMTGGMQNAAWFLLINNPLPQKLMLKIGVLPDADVLRYEKNNLYAEKECFQKLKNENIPIPKLLVFDDSKQFLESPFMIMTYLEGITWRSVLGKLSDENKKILLYQLGRYTAMIHQVTGEKFGYVRKERTFLFDTWSEAFGAMVTAITEDGKERGFELPYPQIDRLLNIYAGVLDEIKTPHLVDFDLWAGNIMLRDADEQSITGIFDFGNSFYGDPFAEFVTAVHLYKNVRDEKEFQKGYSEITKRPFEVTENDGIRMKLYQLYLDLILYIESYRYDGIQRKHQEKMKNKILGDIADLQFL